MDRYGLIGFPLSHSFSQRFFTEKFEKERIEASYSRFEIPQISDITNIIASEAQLKGLNVTIPYKEKVIEYLDELSSQAKEIGAVNVIKLKRKEGKTSLIGYNTDVIGFERSIAPLIDKGNYRKALILGTGGASKAVVYGLRNLNIESVYVSRSPRKGAYAYNDLDEEVMRKHEIIVNTSPLGTFPNVDEAPDIPYEHLTIHHLLYDLVYNPAETKFLRLGKERGAVIKNGLEMLELQALAAWDIWNNK